MGLRWTRARGGSSQGVILSTKLKVIIAQPWPCWLVILAPSDPISKIWFLQWKLLNQTLGFTVPMFLSDSDLWCWKRFLLKEMLKPHLTIDGDIQQGLFKHWCRRIAKAILPMFFQRQFFSKTSYDWIPENSSPPWALYDFFCHFESSFTLQPFNPLTQPFCCTNVSLVLRSL